MDLAMEVGELAHKQQVNGQANYKRAAPIWLAEAPSPPRMHMVIAALDYKRTGRPLSCTIAARSIEELARQCGVHILVPLYDEECTRDAVLNAVRETTSQCGPEDVFIFYFAGHGTGTEEVGGDSNHLVLVDQRGQVSAKTLLSGDDLACTVLSSVPDQTRVLFIMDTSFQALLVDLDRCGVARREVLSITGTQDPNCPEEDRGNILTHTVLLAIDKLSKVGRDNYSVGMLFNAALHENDIVFNNKQDLTIQSAPGFTADAMAWPLVPPLGYQAPLSRCAGPGGIRSDSARGVLAASVLPHVRQEALNVPVSIEEYISLVNGSQFMFQYKPCRACSAGYGAGGCCVQ